MLRLLLVLLVSIVMFSQSAFASYGYHVNKYGTGYFHDDSNDGDSSNNANTLGLNR